MDFKWKTTLSINGCSSPLFNGPSWQAKFRLQSFSAFNREHWDLHLKITDPRGANKNKNFKFGLSVHFKNKDGEARLFFCRQIIGIENRYSSVMKFSKETLECNDFITNGKVSLHFGFDLKNASQFFQENSMENIQPVRPSIQTTCLQNFSKDIEALFDSVEHSDVQLKCGDRKFFLIKNILSARSEVFAAMLKTKMIESSSGIITVDDIQPAIMEQFLRYVYSGRVDTLAEWCMDSVFDLYRAGDKYAVPSLKHKCASFMVDKIADDNVCKVLLFAHTFEDVELLSNAVSFAACRAEFLKSEEWNTFAEEHPNVAVKVFLKLHVK